MDIASPENRCRRVSLLDETAFIVRVGSLTRNTVKARDDQDDADEQNPVIRNRRAHEE
ncbi:hypothetical protein HPP92_004917 [Vanilla planifolia]|uniref:Uncharacterized protein n=1 Tax=Vanilla planifolia TaxID=51239 RepID=A0A835RXQ5_VANPL|nr:hypothetical protein HPP92_004917 [Vanilla planifolia]